jgi:hypothetical protein
MSDASDIILGILVGMITTLILGGIIIDSIKTKSKNIQEVNINGITLLKIREPESIESTYYYLGRKAKIINTNMIGE